jgi:hypothetical protein
LVPCFGVSVFSQQVVDQHDPGEAIGDRMMDRQNQLACAAGPIADDCDSSKWSGCREVDLEEPPGF